MTSPKPCLLSTVAILLLGASSAGVVFAEAPPPAKPTASKHAKISIDEARQRALEAVRGDVRHEELEKERGHWIYSFEIIPTGGKKGHLKEVNIDAESGKVVNIEDETYKVK
jgi:uncharacterized membrane protein YkoI